MLQPGEHSGNPIILDWIIRYPGIKKCYPILNPKKQYLKFQPCSLEIISHGTVFFSHNKSANSTFQSGFSAKQTGPKWQFQNCHTTTGNRTIPMCTKNFKRKGKNYQRNQLRWATNKQIPSRIDRQRNRFLPMDF